MGKMLFRVRVHGIFKKQSKFPAQKPLETSGTTTSISSSNNHNSMTTMSKKEVMTVHWVYHIWVLLTPTPWTQHIKTSIGYLVSFNACMLGGGFKYRFFTLTWGNDPIFPIFSQMGWHHHQVYTYINPNCSSFENIFPEQKEALLHPKRL